MKLINNIHVFEKGEKITIPDELPPLPVDPSAKFGHKLDQEDGKPAWRHATQQELRSSLERLGISGADIDAHMVERAGGIPCSYDGHGCSGECAFAICSGMRDPNDGHIIYCYCYSGPSSARYKRDIAGIDSAAESLLRLRPVSFHYNDSFGPELSKRLQFGLIAEEVEQVLPDLVRYSDDGKVDSVQYSQLPALLVSQMQKQHQAILDQQREIEILKTTVGRLQSAIDVNSSR